MNKFVVTTSIYPPSEATKKLLEKKDWTLIVVGDKKTPHELYENIEGLIYLSPELQDNRYPKLSEALGWDCIQRRNVGFLEAFHRGADVVATIDDDNIPYANWGEDILIGKTINISTYANAVGVFDPMRVTSRPDLWHRGYPLELVDSPTFYKGEQETKILIQANLWDGDPDVDAVCRKLYHPSGIRLNVPGYFTTRDYTPFDSQNTLLAREILHQYMVLPGVGRMDDIWGGYICEYLAGTRPIFGPPTVYQNRNEQSTNRNFKDEELGYIATLKFIKEIEDWRGHLPEDTLRTFDIYQEEYERTGVI